LALLSRISSARIPPGFILGAVLTAASLASGCSRQATAEGEPGSGGEADAVPVTIAEVVQKPMRLEVRAIGTVEPSSAVAVRSQITGALTSVNFSEGDDVQEGQVLFTLDRRPLEAALAQAQANLARDLAQAANAASQAERVRQLADRGIATREQVQTSTTNAAALEATVAADRAAVENATVQLQYATITAPISGRTGALLVDQGNLVRANDATPLVVINRIAPINVAFAIPEDQLPAFKGYLAQGSLRLDASPPNETGPGSRGTISFVDNAVDHTTGTITIKGRFPNDDLRLWPGQFVNVVVTLTTDPAAIVVPTVAVQTGPQGPYVFAVTPDQTVELQPVTVARTSGAETIIGDGLKNGDTVITDGQLLLVQGSRISVRTNPPEQATP
jgi:membrane fusion protein, multidrug efflux system